MSVSDPAVRRACAAAFLLLALAAAVFGPRPIAAAEPTAVAAAEQADASPAPESLLESATVKKVAEGCKFTEGPAVDAAGNLYFSDGPNDRILRRSGDGTLSVFRKPARRTNGMAFDAQGRLLMCQSSGAGGGRRVARLEADGSETALADRYEGRELIGPNDICVDGGGRIWFTDPNYGPEKDEQGNPAPKSGVYRIDFPAAGGQPRLTRAVDNLKRPNGILVTADSKLLYVSDRGTQKLHRYKIRDDGSLEHVGALYDFSPDRGIDGMRLDERGNIFGAAGEGKTTGLFVISPEGKRLLHLPLPEFATNVCFGGPERRDLFLTAGGSVYHVKVKTPGMKLPVGKP